jgi:hypothetical protein
MVALCKQSHILRRAPSDQASAGRGKGHRGIGASGRERPQSVKNPWSGYLTGPGPSAHDDGMTYTNDFDRTSPEAWQAWSAATGRPVGPSLVLAHHAGTISDEAFAVVAEAFGIEL